MKVKYKFLDHPSDAYIEAYGDTLEELLENSALALFDVMVNVNKVKPKVVREVEVKGFDLENLLYNWLEEWLFHYCSESLVFSKFKVEKLSKENREYVVKAKGWGEEFNPEKHEPEVEVKAATYYQMSISRKNNKWVARFILDI